MDPHAQLVSQLFSASKRASNLRELKTYYFHNCVYGRLFETERFTDPVKVRDVLEKCGPEWKLVMVGDAAMHPAELLEAYGNIDPRRHSKTTGIDWLKRFADHFDRAVWINPEPAREWDYVQTTRVIRKLFPMFHLSVDGITDAVKALVGARI